MFSVLTEGCHVGYSRQFVGAVYCTYGQTNTTSVTLVTSGLSDKICEAIQIAYLLNGVKLCRTTVRIANENKITTSHDNTVTHFRKNTFKQFVTDFGMFINARNYVYRLKILYSKIQIHFVYFYIEKSPMRTIGSNIYKQPTTGMYEVLSMNCITRHFKLGITKTRVKFWFCQG